MAKNEPIITLSGTVRSRTKVEREKKDTEKLTGQIVVMNDDGHKALLLGPESFFESVAAEEQVTIKVYRTNEKLVE